MRPMDTKDRCPNPLCRSDHRNSRGDGTGFPCADPWHEGRSPLATVNGYNFPHEKGQIEGRSSSPDTCHDCEFESAVHAAHDHGASLPAPSEETTDEVIRKLDDAMHALLDQYGVPANSLGHPGVQDGVMARLRQYFESLAVDPERAAPPEANAPELQNDYPTYNDLRFK